MSYISDKDLVKIVIFPYFLGTLALNGINKEKERFFKLCTTFYLEILQIYNKEDRLRKINKRINVKAREAMLALMDKQTHQLNTHKAIIAVNIVAVMAFETGKIARDLHDKLSSLFEPFQEVESRMVMSEEEWLTLKKSAEKQAKRIYEIFYK